MKDRGKDLEQYPNATETSTLHQNNDMNSSILFCKKHSSTSSTSSSSTAVGICALCLNDRLVELFCPECGEQILSSCSCSELSSNPNSNPEGVASVGRISFLLENDQKPSFACNNNNSSLLNTKQYYNSTQHGPFKPLTDPGHPTAAYLWRSNSSCVGGRDVVNTKRGFWRIGKMFRKKTHRGKNTADENDDSRSEMCVSDIVGVSRSRSVSSFRGNYTNYNHDSNRNSCSGGGGGGGVMSGARLSSVSTGGFMMDSAKRSCFSESEARISNFEYDKDLFLSGPPPPPPHPPQPSKGTTTSFFAMREISNGVTSGEFSCGDDDPRFIDLKLDNMQSSYGFGGGGGSFVRGDQLSEQYGHYGNFRNGGGGGGVLFPPPPPGGGGGGAASSSSSRFSNVSEGEIRKCSRKRHKVWRWFFKSSSSTKLGK